MKKKKVYVLMVSMFFPKTHPCAGEQTQFLPKIIAGCGHTIEYEFKGQKYIYDRKKDYQEKCFAFGWTPKIHTIRGNYDLWKKRADKINAGEAVLSLRQWTGSPYNFARDGSKQVEVMQLEKVGVERITLMHDAATITPQSIGVKRVVLPWNHPDSKKIATNDGLTFRDFWNWFCPPFKNPAIGRIMNFEGVIIHFTDFRYIN